MNNRSAFKIDVARRNLTVAESGVDQKRKIEIFSDRAVKRVARKLREAKKVA